MHKVLGEGEGDFVQVARGPGPLRPGTSPKVAVSGGYLLRHSPSFTIVISPSFHIIVVKSDIRKLMPPPQLGTIFSIQQLLTLSLMSAIALSISEIHILPPLPFIRVTEITSATDICNLDATDTAKVTECGFKTTDSVKTQTVTILGHSLIDFLFGKVSILVVGEYHLDLVVCGSYLFNIELVHHNYLPLFLTFILYYTFFDLSRGFTKFHINILTEAKPFLTQIKE